MRLQTFLTIALSLIFSVSVQAQTTTNEEQSMKEVCISHEKNILERVLG